MDIELKEYGPSKDVARLSPAVAAGLSALATVTNLGRDRSRVTPGAKVGVLRVGDVTVHVRPKIEIIQLLFLVDYARDPVKWKDADPPAGVMVQGDLAATVADVYVRFAEGALRHGPLQGYQQTAASLPVLKGRLRLGEQIAARHGQSFPFEVSYSSYGPDIAENRILAAAARLAVQLPRLHSDTQARLGQLLRRLPAVSPAPEVAKLGWRRTRLNAHYVDALRLADLIIAGSAFAPNAGDLPVYGFVLNMWDVFEDFVRTALGEAMRLRIRGTYAKETIKIDLANKVDIELDFLFRVAGRPAAVADAKYKRDHKRHREDFFQVVTYCLALGLRRGHLVYAEGNPAPIVHEIPQTGMRVVRHALDLSRSQAGLLADIDRLAAELVDDARERLPHPSQPPPIPGGRA